MHCSLTSCNCYTLLQSLLLCLGYCQLVLQVEVIMAKSPSSLRSQAILLLEGSISHLTSQDSSMRAT